MKGQISIQTHAQYLCLMHAKFLEQNGRKSLILYIYLTAASFWDVCLKFNKFRWIEMKIFYVKNFKN